MSIAALIRAMADAGATPEVIAIAVEAIEERDALLRTRRSVDAERKRRQRARESETLAGQSQDSHVTVTGQSQDICHPLSSPPLSPPDPQTPPPYNPPPAPKPRAKSVRGCRLADDFEMPEDWIAWAVQDRGWQRLDAVEEAAAFIDFWHAKPGADAAKLDWPATWRNWCRNSRRNGNNGRRNPMAGNNGPQPRQYRRDIASELLAEAAAEQAALDAANRQGDYCEPGTDLAVWSRH